MGEKRVSHEGAATRWLLDRLDLHGREVYTGLGAANRFGIEGWGLTPGQQFQYGDLRFEAEDLRLVVEIESAGGLTNLVKYWPLLPSAAASRRFLLIHVFHMSSDGDYIAHRRLWEHVRQRMIEDLGRRGLACPARWDAAMYTYRDLTGLDPVLNRIRCELSC